MIQNSPLFISFYTTNGKYPEQAKRLKKTLDQFSLDYCIDELTPFKTWVQANTHRIEFIINKIRKHHRTVIWIDCDCEIKKYPELLMLETDFSIINWHAIQGHHLDGKIEYNKDTYKALFSGGISKWSPASLTLLQMWQQLCIDNNTIPEDQVLSWLWNNQQNKIPKLNVLWLPKEYLAGLFKVEEVDIIIQTEYTPYNNLTEREMRWEQENLSIQNRK